MTTREIQRHIEEIYGAVGVHWNTVYLNRAVTHLRHKGRNIPYDLLRHISPLSWEHINLTGIYSWDTEQPMPGGFRPLRLTGTRAFAG